MELVNTPAAAHADRFMGRFIDFETVAEPAEAAAGGEAAAGTAEAPASAAPASTSTDEGAAEAVPTGTSFDPNDPAVQQWFNQQLEQQLQPLIQALTPQQEAPSFELDPFADDFTNQLGGLLQFQLQQVLAPYLPAIQAAENEQIVKFVDSHLDQAMTGYPDVSGDTDGDRQAILFAAAGFRATIGDDARAITEARKFTEARDQKIAQKAVADYKASLQGGNAAGRDPGVNGAAIGIEPRATSYDDVLARYDRMTPTGAA